MKLRYMVIIIMIFPVVIGSACSSRMIEARISEKVTGVFTELKGINSTQGQTVLSINTSFKTHPIGFYSYESDKSPHGKQTYRVLVNIDGQPVVWNIQGVRESTPVLDENDKRIKDTEAGDGMRYTLDKKISINPGKYHVFFSLPDDDLYTEFDINIIKGDNTVKIKPIYFIYGKRRKVVSFLGGILKFKAIYNGTCCLE